MISGKWRELVTSAEQVVDTAPAVTDLLTHEFRHTDELVFQIDDTVGPGTQVLNVTLQGSMDNVNWYDLYFFLVDVNVWNQAAAVNTNAQAANTVQLYWTNHIMRYMRIRGSRVVADVNPVVLSHTIKTSP